MKPDIVIVDYGVGNLHSVFNACKQFTNNVVVSDDAEVIKAARGLILPGVGAFEAGMEGLRVRNLVEVVKEFAESGKPILGICLGAQLLLTTGYEFGEWEGLNLIEGEVIKFPTATSRLPHIGWSAVLGFGEDPLFQDVPEGSDMYFVHSYILKPTGNTIATARYGDVEFAAAIRKGSIYGVQFHPEKSAQAGMQIIRNFVTLATRI